MFGHGSSCLWGYSKAVDLNAVAQTDDLNRQFLILGASDARHVIATAAKAYKHSLETLTFYILEPSAPILCRNLLFLNLLWNPKVELGITDKVEMFLEIYGNILVREKSRNLLKEAALELIGLVNGNGQLSQLFDFSLLKYRERDDLEAVFKFWKDDTKSFNIQDLWIRRMQQYLGRRYDSRDNIVDWDYQMKVLDCVCLLSYTKDKKSLSILSRSEYLNWRLSGNAYEIRDASQNMPNKTVATVDVLKEDGVGVVKWGYFSDIVMGPFITFGIDAEDKELLKTQNDKHIKTSQEIATHNISSLIYEFAHHAKMTGDGTISEISDEQINPLANIKVICLPCDPSYLFSKKRANYEEFFDGIFISNSLAHRIADAGPLLKKDGYILAETAKFMPELSKEQRDLFVEKELSMAKDAKLMTLSSENEAKMLDVIKLIHA